MIPGLCGACCRQTYTHSETVHSPLLAREGGNRGLSPPSLHTPGTPTRPPPWAPAAPQTSEHFRILDTTACFAGNMKLPFQETEGGEISASPQVVRPHPLSLWGWSFSSLTSNPAQLRVAKKAGAFQVHGADGATWLENRRHRCPLTSTSGVSMALLGQADARMQASQRMLPNLPERPAFSRQLTLQASCRTTNTCWTQELPRFIAEFYS